MDVSFFNDGKTSSSSNVNTPESTLQIVSTSNVSDLVSLSAAIRGRAGLRPHMAQSEDRRSSTVQ